MQQQLQVLRTVIKQGLAVLALTLPWLSPLAGGPSPAVTPWLVTLACLSVVLWGLTRWRVDVAHAAAQAWLIAALLSSLMGLVQYAGLSAALSPWVNGAAAGEAFANLRQRNQFATLSSIGLVALLWFAAQPRGREAGPMFKGLAIGAAVVLALGNAASSSRTGLTQLVLLCGLGCLWSGWRQAQTWRLLAIALAAYVIAVLALPALADQPGTLGRLSSGDAQCASRLTLWSNVLHLIRLRPWLGWGWGELDYAHFMTLYVGPRFCDLLDNAHNLPLHFAVELGLPVAVLICGAAAWLIWRARPWGERHATRQMAWALLALIVLHSLLEYPLWYGPFQLALGLCLVLLWSQRGTKLPNADKATTLNAAWGLIAAGLLALSAYAAWDYHRISQIYLAVEQRAPAYREDTLEKIRASWLFGRQVHFAEFTLTPLTRDNAAQLNAQAHELLHYSPEARVVEKLIESAVMLGRDDEALFYLVRYRAAYPQAHARWAQANAR